MVSIRRPRHSSTPQARLDPADPAERGRNAPKPRNRRTAPTLAERGQRVVAAVKAARRFGLTPAETRALAELVQALRALVGDPEE